MHAQCVSHNLILEHSLCAYILYVFVNSISFHIYIRVLVTGIGQPHIHGYQVKDVCSRLVGHVTHQLEGW